MRISIVAWELRGNKANGLLLATVAGLVTLMAAPWLLKNRIWLLIWSSPSGESRVPKSFHAHFRRAGEDEYRRYLQHAELPAA